MDNRKLKTPEPADALAGETGTGATQKERFTERVERYGKAKTTALTILDYIVSNHGDSPQYKSLITDMGLCGNYLVFRDYYTVGDIRLKAAFTCKKQLLCPLCAIRRGAKLVQRYHERYQAITEANPNLNPYLVTFTVKDGESLSERFSKLREGIRQYHRRRSRKNSSCEALRASGAVWSYEVKRGKNSGLWHPHVHAVWLCESKPDQAQIRREWSQVLGDGSFMVDCRPIDTSDTVGGFLEVFKYATKFSDQPPSDTWHVYTTLKGRRLIGSFGDFRGIPEPENLNDELLENELPYIDRFFNYFGGRYIES